ncbi:hypothetical protein CNEO2_390034 [Clostridium neonatale]|nr:hypothetical protein CNEO4_320034 [Clostridium neonatale]CAI3664900.1 hypothetical protein CNEO2_390034 [Clostridium neonatale]
MFLLFYINYSIINKIYILKKNKLKIIMKKIKLYKNSYEEYYI